MDNSETRRGATLADITTALATHEAVELVGEDVTVSDVHMDSRSVTPGSLYVAIRGRHTDGHRFVAGAVNAGAVAAVVEEDPEIDIPHLLTDDTRRTLGWIAAEVYDHPSRDLNVIGITGTNGKTTVAHMLASMIDGADRVTAVVGTVSANLGEDYVSPRTTPEASELQRTMRRLVDEGRITDIAVEVSSHAMVMGRVNGVEFDLVAFTNLSQDHLDYHQTMEGYYRAKAGLFQRRWAPQGVIWTDDEWGRRLLAETEIPVLTVGTGADADFRVSYGSEGPGGSTFTLDSNEKTYEIKTVLAGRFNVANAAIALACAHVMGIDLEAAVAGLAAMKPIPGRYNTLANDRGLWVVIDYAHTPDAISGVIAQSRPLVGGRVIVVIGAGGDRDQKKRPMMGEAAAGADLVIVTNDNPRSEDPAAIIDQIVSGMPPDTTLEVVPDRRDAIRRALGAGLRGDAVLILGKGHEVGQEFADRVDPFDDRTVAAQELERLAGMQP